MFSIFISARSLTDFFYKESKKQTNQCSDWFEIMIKQKELFIERDIHADFPFSNIEEVDDPMSLSHDQITAAMLLDYSQAYGLACSKSNCDYNSELDSDPSILLNESHRAYLLDVEEEKAENLQKSYGIICQSTKNLDNCVLSSSTIPYNVKEGTKNRSWKDLFDKIPIFPINTLVIIDRYLLGWDGKEYVGFEDGVYNLKEIIKSAAPDELCCPFHVMLLFDETNCNDTNFPFPEKCLEKLNNEITALVADMEKPYPIEFEMFSIGHISNYYKSTHKRRILSNCYMIDAPDGIREWRAVDRLDKHNDGKTLEKESAIYTQKIELNYLYSFLNYGYEDNPVFLWDDLLNDLKCALQEADSKHCDANTPYRVYYNMESIKPRQLKNRLIKIA